MKKCFKCGRIKALALFYEHPEMADGHLNKCKSCTKKDVKARYDNPVSREVVRRYEAERAQDPERKTKVLEYQRKRRATKPGKERARRAVANAIKSGKISREPCEVCGDNQSQAHHTDYRRPLFVRWLCFEHHRAEHNQIVGSLI